MINIHSRSLSYIAVAGSLTLSYFFLRSFSWQGSAQLHTLMECMATLLAFMVGSMALVDYYSRRDDAFLIIGTPVKLLARHADARRASPQHFLSIIQIISMKVCFLRCLKLFL